MSRPPLYPLRFEPVFRRYLWGGRRLQTMLGKAIGPEDDYAESWEVVDRGPDQSVVAAGPLAGATLHELTLLSGRELLGHACPQPRFPLLWKFLDANKALSLQVHPNDEQAALLAPPDLGKTEAWFVLAAEPGSYLYAGLRPGVDARLLKAGIERGECEQLFMRHEPQAGDCFFLPAGIAHALGPGLLVAEIQQSSDTTYRLYDWNRKGPDGQTRPLHVEQGLRVADFNAKPVEPCRGEQTSRSFARQMVRCDKFVLERLLLRDDDASVSLGGDNRCHIVAVVAGEVELDGDPSNKPLKAGDVALLPAACGATRIVAKGQADVLEAWIP